jgi:hypothetical protein
MKKREKEKVRERKTERQKDKKAIIPEGMISSNNFIEQFSDKKIRLIFATLFLKGATIFSTTTLSIMTFSITTLSIKVLLLNLNKNGTQH